VTGGKLTYLAGPRRTLNFRFAFTDARDRGDGNNFSPRPGLARSPSSMRGLRAGFGLYYDRLPLASFAALTPFLLRDRTGSRLTSSSNGWK
jgi:hypothetical protein